MKEIVRVEHIWCDHNDRWIYIETYREGEIGLNFMQGDEYEYFKSEWCVVDEGLSDFYQQMRSTLFKQEDASTRDEFINTVMWVYHSARSCWEGDNQRNKK